MKFEPAKTLHPPQVLEVRSLELRSTRRVACPRRPRVQTPENQRILLLLELPADPLFMGLSRVKVGLLELRSSSPLLLRLVKIHHQNYA